MGKQSVPTFARLMTLTTLEGDTDMLSLYVLVEDVDGAREAAVCALPPGLRLHHVRPDQAVRGLVHLIPETASCSKDLFKSGHSGSQTAIATDSKLEFSKKGILVEGLTIYSPVLVL